MAGSVSISLDLELGWGAVGSGMWKSREADGMYDNVRPAISVLLNELDICEVTCTWAVVGGLIDTNPLDSVGHLGSQYKSDVVAFLKNSRESSRDARDIVESIRSKHVQHSFGTHSYSHLRFTDTENVWQVVAADVDHAVRVNRENEIDYEFLVCPENRVNHVEKLGKTGIKIVRANPKNSAPLNISRSAIRRLLGNIFRPIAAAEYTKLSENLMLLHSSELVDWGNNQAGIKRPLIERRIRKALSAASSGSDIHLWLHPYNLVETKGLLEYTTGLIREIASLRDSGKIEVRLPNKLPHR